MLHLTCSSNKPALSNDCLILEILSLFKYHMQFVFTKSTAP